MDALVHLPGHVGQDRVGELEQVPDATLLELVVHKLPPPLASDQATTRQTRQMGGDVGYGVLGELRDLPDAPLPVQQGFEDSQPSRVRETAKQLGLERGNVHRGRHGNLQCENNQLSD